ncbi:hypothetical protein Vretimale_989 [Volvox reticuliferus]|uniref:UDENN domain-containing protein n=1 Tax=Volvox reticuliferus TaxID=1737510 RepID=A0A8J4CGM6_9CHLO|nr:hypothetical protein Vretifemale_10474 [Volvox reticuliferus]GIL94914.1 hypothetical protein Vretimale_989 [Volvox reticuliferus]
MKNGVDSKRVEDSALARLGRSLASVFKPSKRDIEKPEPAGPGINPEALTAQKREWIDSQAAQVHQALATWPEHLFEHFFVVGLPPDIEVTRIAEDLWAQEVRQRQDGGEQSAASATATAAGGRTGGSSNTVGGGRAGGKSQQYDKAPRPAYDAQVLFRHPVTKAAPLSDQELVDLCFPHRVTPVKLRRSPSMSSLHEVVYGRHAAARDDQCFIFLLKVGTNLPLYGICCAVPEVLHRPPHLARHLYPTCRMPFRSVMIAAPRVYCLLSHYPFFDLHFQVLNVLLGMERLHRTIDFNAEMDCGAASSAATAAATVAVGAATTRATTAAGSGGGGGDGADGPGTPPHHATAHPQQPQTPQPHQQQRGAVRLSSRCYCHDCANAIVDMYPGLLQPREPDPLRHVRPSRLSATGRLLDDPWVTPLPATVATAAAAPTGGRGPPQEAMTGLAPIRSHGSVRRVSDPGSAGLASPRPDPVAVTVAAELQQSRKHTSNGGGAGGGGILTSVMSSAGRWATSDEGYRLSAPALAEMECCQACGRVLGWAPALPQRPPGDASLAAEVPAMPTMPTVAEVPKVTEEQSSREDAAVALESTLDKLALLPRALAAGVSEAAAAAAGVLRRGSPGPSGFAHTTGGVRISGPQLKLSASGDGAAAANGDATHSDNRIPYPQSDSFLSSDMGTPHAVLPSNGSFTARALVAAPAEAMSTFASIVRGSLKAIGGGAINVGGGRRRRSVEGSACDSDVSAAAAAAAAERPDGLHIHRLGPEQAAFINVHMVSPLQSRRSLYPLTEASGGLVAAQSSGSRGTVLAAWHSGAVACAGSGSDNAYANQGLEARAESLVQQLMRSVMAPLSPAQSAAALEAEPYSPAGRGPGFGLLSGVLSTIQSPVLPSSPRQDLAHQQEQLANARVRASSSGAQLPSAVCGGAAAAYAASSAATPAAGNHYGWSLLQRLSRRPQCRSAGGELYPGREGKGELCSSEHQEPLAAPEAAGAVAALTIAAARPSGDRNSSGGGGESRFSMASAFATAIDQAALVEQQMASPRTPLTDNISTNTTTEAAMAAAVTESAAARTSDGTCMGPQLTQRYREAVGAAGAAAAAVAPRPAGSPGGQTPETALPYSMPSTGLASRLVTAPGDGSQAQDTGGDGAAVAGGDVTDVHGVTCDRGEGHGVHQHSHRLLLQSQPQSSGSAALLAAAPHLMAEQSGISANPSDGSFYSAEGPEEDCTPRGEAGAAGGAASDGYAEAAPPPWRPSPFQTSSSANALSVSPSLSAPQVLEVLSSRGVGGGRRIDLRMSVELPPQYPYGGSGAAIPVVPKIRGPAGGPFGAQPSVPLPGLPLTPAGPCGGGGGDASAGGGGGGGGRTSQSNAASASAPGPSRLARTSAPLSQGHGNADGGGGTLVPLPPLPPPPLVSAAAPPSPTRARNSATVGAAAAAANTPPAAAPPSLAPVTMHGSGGVVSPPPAGVAVTSDMTHHFSPRHALDQLYSHPLVHPGEQMTLRFGGVATLQFTRPVLGRRFTVVGPPRAIQAYAEAELAEGLQHWTAAVLCRSLSLDNLLLVLTALLLERQVVVFCPHIAVLSGCVLGLLPLLRPFCWQSLLLPVTPASMMGFLEAPVPFVLGVQYKTSEVMARCSHLIRVNVYKDQVKNAGAALPQLPGLKRLTAALAPHHALLRSSRVSKAALGSLLAGKQADVPLDGGRSLRTLSPVEMEAASSFLSILANHLGSLCGDLRPHVITNVGLSKRTGVLMKESLLEVIPQKDKPFVRQLVETQMFSVWSDALISANFEGTFAAN